MAEIIMDAEESAAWLAERDKREAEDALIAKSAGRVVTMGDLPRISENIFRMMKAEFDKRDAVIGELSRRVSELQRR